MKVKEKYIRAVRLKKEYSQEYISRLLGVSQPKYSRLENGEIPFNIDELSKLIDVLELNPFDLFDFTEKEQIFINSSNLDVINSKLNSVDEELIRAIVKEEIKKLIFKIF